EEEFSCPLGQEGEACRSSWDIYKRTGNGKSVKQSVAEEAAGGGASEADDAKNGKSDFVIDNYVAPRLPDDPIPVRTPPQVMRIWIAPYEDTDGDFIVTGYVYTEVQPRRWTLGVNTEETQNPALYQPLQRK
ncbi:MAG: TraV family lipoprotein, partial [Succinivibrio sp.]